MKIDKNLYPISRLHRADVQHALGLSDEATDKLTPEQIELIADKMGHAYLEKGFWTDLEVLAKEVLNGEE